MPELHWKEQARRMWATGTYTKVAIARELGRNANVVAEAIDPELGRKWAEARRVAARKRYHEREDVRLKEIARVRRNQVRRTEKPGSK